jgi:hypothetical protein
VCVYVCVCVRERERSRNLNSEATEARVGLWRHTKCKNSPIVRFWEVWLESNMYRSDMSVSVGNCELVYTKNSQLNANLIGRNITAPPPLLSPNSNLQLPTSHCAGIPVRKNSARLPNMPLPHFPLNLLLVRICVT